MARLARGSSPGVCLVTDPRITQQARLGYNADAHAQSVKGAKAFLAEILKLN